METITTIINAIGSLTLIETAIIVYFLCNMLCYSYHRRNFKSVYSISPDNIIMCVHLILFGVFVMMFIGIIEFIYRDKD